MGLGEIRLGEMGLGEMGQNLFIGARRRGSNTPVLQETLENVLTATIILTGTLVVLEVTSVT